MRERERRDRFSMDSMPSDSGSGAAATARPKHSKIELLHHPLSVAQIMKMGRSEVATFLKTELAKERLGESLDVTHFPLPGDSSMGQSSASSPADERPFRSLDYPRFHSTASSYAESNEGIVEENDDEEDRDHRFADEYVEDATAVLVMDTAEPEVNLNDLLTAEQQQVQHQQQIHFDQKTSGTYYLNLVMDELLTPDKSIDLSDTIKWCKRLIEGGRKSDEFAAIGE